MRAIDSFAKRFASYVELKLRRKNDNVLLRARKFCESNAFAHESCVLVKPGAMSDVIA
jgi:hypothetical protein